MACARAIERLRDKFHILNQLMSFDAILQQCGLDAAPGSKTSSFIPVAGTPVQLPATVIAGSQPGPQILVTGGVHGGEYPCIETAIRLARHLQPADIHGRVVIIHPVNPPAFLARMQYFGPYDGKNLNRVFPGKATGTVSERIAYTVHQLQLGADFYIDLHGGDIHEALLPFVIYSRLGEQAQVEISRAAAAAMGFPYVVGSYSENGSIGSAAQAGIPGFLAELGQCGRWSEGEVEEYLAGVHKVLRHLGTIPGGREPEKMKVSFMEKMLVVNAADDGCWYPAVQLGEMVAKGQKLGEIRDFFGNQLSEYFAEADGLLLYLVTSLAITAGDPLTAIGVQE